MYPLQYPNHQNKFKVNDIYGKTTRSFVLIILSIQILQKLIRLYVF